MACSLVKVNAIWSPHSIQSSGYTDSSMEEKTASVFGQTNQLPENRPTARGPQWHEGIVLEWKSRWIWGFWSAGMRILYSGLKKVPPKMVSMESDQRLHGRFQRNKRITLPPSPHQSRSWTPHGLIWSYHLLPVPYPYPKFKGQKQQMHLGFKVFRYLHSITSCPTAKSNSPSPLANLRHLSTWSGKFGIHNCQCQTETSTLRSSKC